MVHILLIDDDVVLLTRLETQLTEAGYTVSKSNELGHAEKLLAESAIDLVLLDPATNNGQGWETLKRIAPLVTVILISGDGLEEDIVRALDLGAVDFLAKPFRTSELLARIRSRLRHRPLPAEAALKDAAPVPSTSNAVDRLRRSAMEQQQPEQLDAIYSEPGTAPPAARSATNPPLGERPLETGRAPSTEETVFMTPDEEQKLFATKQQSSDELRIDEINQLTLGQRLKTARQRRRLTLVQAELDTRIRMSYIQAMEEEKFALLPSGPGVEDMLRQYSNYLGLDVDSAIQEYEQRHFNQPVAQLIALGGTPPPRQLPRWLAWLSAALLALSLGGGLIWWLDPNILNTVGSRVQLLGSTPTLTPLPSPTATLAPTATPQPTATVTAVPSATSTSTATASPTPSATAALTVTRTVQP